MALTAESGALRAFFVSFNLEMRKFIAFLTTLLEITLGLIFFDDDIDFSFNLEAILRVSEAVCLATGVLRRWATLSRAIRALVVTR